MTQELSAQEQKAKVWQELDAGGSAASTQPTEVVEQQSQQAEQLPQGSQAASNEAAALDAAAATNGAAQDPYAGVPDFVKNEILGLKSMLTQTQSRLRQAEGHIGGLNSQLKQVSLQRVAQATDNAGGTAPSASQIREAQGSDADMAKLLEEYPEFGAAVKAALDSSLAGVKAEIARIAQAPRETAAPTVSREDLVQLEKTMLVESKHPGWKEKVASPQFRGWFDQQPREVQMLGASEDPRDAIRLLDLAAASTAPREQQQQRLSAAAAMPTGRASPGARTKPVEQMTKAEYWAYLDELQKA